MKFSTSMGTKVARRVVALFVVCALLPVAAAILLSYGSVRESLEQQRVDALRAAAANYATSLVDRLHAADSLARVVAARGAAAGVQGGIPGGTDYFRAIVLRDAAGLRLLMGESARAPILDRPYADEERLAMDESTLAIVPQPGGPGAIWLVRGPRQNRLALEVEPRFLWAADDALPASTDICIFGADGAMLHCTRQIPGSVLESLRARLPGRQSQEIGWEAGGEAMTSAHRELFLRGKFGAAPWDIVVTQPEKLALAAADGVTRAVAPVVLLGLLVAALLGLVQVRRIMRPLKDLTDAAARIGSRDFRTSVPYQRDDEFGALARAFNGMSGRLARQFDSLAAQAEIDAVTLTGVDLPRVTQIALRRMTELVRADKHLVVLAAEDPGVYRVHSLNPADGQDKHELEIPAAEAGRLAAAPEGMRLSGMDGSALAALAGLRTRHAFALPITVDREFAGAIVLANVEDRVPAADDVALLRNFADRIAVAIGTARRDRELDRRAHYDSLTQLPNRHLGVEELARAVAAAERRRSVLAVLFVDLDGFSSVNDALGHPAGDQLLVQCAQRLSGSVRKADIVARLGGDEFAVLLPEVRTGADAALVARHAIEALSSEFDLGVGRAFVSASVGIALYPDDGTSAEVLLRHADLAMYQAKRQGRGNIAFFEAAMNADLQHRVALEQEMRVALKSRQFELHYQPQLDLRSGRLVGGEALIRWRHPTRGLVPPLQFIGLAEANGLIDPIGRWALETACAKYVEWQGLELAIEHVSVNVSPRQFQDPRFAEQVRSVLEATRMPAAALRLEITESAIMDDQGPARANLAQLSELGVRLELDDFGTGYSSLAHLQQLPVAAIKLDRVFTRHIETKESAQVVVRAAIDMAHALGKAVVAEGVENGEQLALLQRLGCDTMQGYHIGRPMPAEDFEQLLRSRAAAARATVSRVGRVGIEPTTKGL